jgi:hypothetical protein
MASIVWWYFRLMRLVIYLLRDCDFDLDFLFLFLGFLYKKILIDCEVNKKKTLVEYIRIITHDEWPMIMYVVGIYFLLYSFSHGILQLSGVPWDSHGTLICEEVQLGSV